MSLTAPLPPRSEAQLLKLALASEAQLQVAPELALASRACSYRSLRMCKCPSENAGTLQAECRATSDKRHRSRAMASEPNGTCNEYGLTVHFP